MQGEIFPPAPIQCSNVLQIEYKPEEYEVPVRKCEQGQAKKCFEYKVPKWEVVRNLTDPWNNWTSVTSSLRERSR